MLRFLADTFLLEGFGFDAPRGVEDLGIYLPGRGDVTLEEALAGRDPARPVIGVTFCRAHRLTGNTAFVDGLCAAIERAGGTPLPVWSYTLRRGHDDGRVAVGTAGRPHRSADHDDARHRRRRPQVLRRALSPPRTAAPRSRWTGTRARSRRLTCR
jgi:cobalamin biosynthesis Mg chelatase CobN